MVNPTFLLIFYLLKSSSRQNNLFGENLIVGCFCKVQNIGDRKIFLRIFRQATSIGFAIFCFSLKCKLLGGRSNISYIVLTKQRYN